MSSTAASKKRRLGAVSNESLPFGTFHGKTIYRNRLHSGETFEKGHVSIENLVPSQCSSAFCTTFVVGELGWLEQIFGEIPKLLVVTVSNSAEVSTPNIGDAKLVCMSEELRPDWYNLYCQPHTGGCLHSKLLLFRCALGLRVVVCGSNLYQGQWEVDRDCLWVQDFYNSNDGVSCDSDFSKTLRSFLIDMTGCESLDDDAVVQRRLSAIFDGIDMSTAAARLVISFPRTTDVSKTKIRGGYRQLAEIVRDFLTELDTASDYESEDDDESTDNACLSNQTNVVYAMAGSFGNIGPDFLLQMFQAFQGEDRAASRDTPWKDVLDRVRCLWPSHETALTMNLASLIGHTRPIPRDYWDENIPEVAKRRIFHDAKPNPSELGLPQYGCHPVSHAKAMYYSRSKVSILYVGSHNFSKAAWGLRGESPRNVEIGVVLATTSSLLSTEWQDRLPCKLPPVSATSPISYVPASASKQAREMFETQPQEAIEMTMTSLQQKVKPKKVPERARAVRTVMARTNVPSIGGAGHPIVCDDSD